MHSRVGLCSTVMLLFLFFLLMIPHVSAVDIKRGQGFTNTFTCSNSGTSGTFTNVVARTTDPWVMPQEQPMGDLGPGASKTVQFSGTVPVDAPLGPHTVTFQCFGTNPSGASTAMSQPASWQFNVVEAAPQPQTSEEAQPQPQPQPPSEQAQPPESPPESGVMSQIPSSAIDGAAAAFIGGIAAAFVPAQILPLGTPSSDTPPSDTSSSDTPTMSANTDAPVMTADPNAPPLDPVTGDQWGAGSISPAPPEPPEPMNKSEEPVEPVPANPADLFIPEDVLP